MRRAVNLVVGVVFTLSTPSAAQDASQSQGIPADVVTILARYSGMLGEDAELRPGGPPAGFPSAVFPKGSVVHASLVSPTRGTMVIATAAGASLAEIEKHWEGLTSAGWSSFGPSQRGFVFGSPGPTPVSWALCQGTEHITLQALPREAGGFHVRANHTNDPRRGCNTGGSAGVMADVALPRLSPPAGARAIPSGGFGGGMDSMTSATRLETRLAVREVQQHYEQQLTEAGWKVAGRSQDGRNLAISRFDVPSKANLPVTGWLTVTALGETGDVDVFLRLIRTARDPRMTRPAGSISGGISTGTGTSISVTPMPGVIVR